MAGMKVGDEEFNVQIDGPEDAPALMLSNSLGTNLHMWDGQMGVLTKHFRVIRYDSRGHGKSVAADGPYSIEQLAKDALHILDALGIKKAHFMGLSMGGMVGMWLLTHARERIGRAVLCNTGAFMGSPDIWNMRIRAARNGEIESIVPGTIDRWFTKDFQEDSPDAVRRIAAMVRSTPPLGYASCCAAIRDMDQREAIRSISNPVLVVVGKHDPATPPAMGGLIAASIKGARLIDLEAAHLSNIEAETAFNRTVTAFLTAPEKVEAAPAAKPARKAAKKAAKKAGKKAGKKAAKKSAPRKAAAKKTAAKKTAKKAAKKAAKKSAKKPASGPARKAAKKPAKKAAKKAAGKKASRKTAAKKAKRK